ncbi:MAG: potassium channel protein [Spartobacteria bacterium]|nr:potassium channel protein [Spartobacteria bacterium]
MNRGFCIYVAMQRLKHISSTHITRGRLYFAIMALASVVFAGMCGYHFIEEWDWLDSLYMTVITVATVGFGETYPLSPAGRVFTILLIVGGIAMVTYAISVLIEQLFSQRMLHLVQGARMKAISKMDQHCILCGYGRMGSMVADDLDKCGLDFCIIEQDEARCKELEDEGLVFIQGDASEESVLEEAGIRKAKSLVACLDSDASNLFLTITARGMKKDLDIIARVENQRSGHKFLQAGASRVVSPLVSGATHIARMLTSPGMIHFLDLVSGASDMNIEIEETVINETDPFANKTLAESKLKQLTGKRVLAIRKQSGSFLFDPSADTLLIPDDVLITFRKQAGKV